MQQATAHPPLGFSKCIHELSRLPVRRKAQVLSTDATAGADAEAGPPQFSGVSKTAQQQALDSARQHLLHKRQLDPGYASLPMISSGFDTAQRQALDLAIAKQLRAGQAQSKPQELDDSALHDLRHLLPDLEGQWKRLQPEILQGLAADTAAVAAKLLQLKIWFPQANVSSMVATRPTLLLDAEFSCIPDAIAVLHRWFDASAIDWMVQEQPLFLVEDVESAISSLNRWMSTTNGAHKLQRNPQLLLSLVPNRKLSIW